MSEMPEEYTFGTGDDDLPEPPVMAETEADEDFISSITVTGNTRVPFQAVAWERTDSGIIATGWWGNALGNGDAVTAEFIGDMTIEYHRDRVER